MDPASSCLFLGGGPGGTGGEERRIDGHRRRSVASSPGYPAALHAGRRRRMDADDGALVRRGRELGGTGSFAPPGSLGRRGTSRITRAFSPRSRRPASLLAAPAIDPVFVDLRSIRIRRGGRRSVVPALGSASMHLTFRVPRTPFASAMARMHSAAVDAFENLANATPLCGTARTDSRCFRSLGLGFRAAASPLGLASPSAGPFSSSPSRSPSFFGLDLEVPPGSESLVSRSSNARVSVSCPVPFGHTTKSRDLGGSSSAADDVDIPPAPTRSSADDIPRGRE